MTSPPGGSALTIAGCATLACIWEATAPKPGNVHRGADFEDVTYADFVTSATIIGPHLQEARKAGVGATILKAVHATRQAVSTNTNLGTLLLMTPLAACDPEGELPSGIGAVLEKLSAVDTQHVYEAIRHAQPGGLSRVERHDVHAETFPEEPLGAVMRLAADRDLVARQYVTAFREVFETADEIAGCRARGWCLADAIVHAALLRMAREPDSLIVRKLGPERAREAGDRAAEVLSHGSPEQASYRAALAELDFWLRSDGHRRNPGTTADLVAAGLFVLLRDNRLDWPVRFYPQR